MSREQTTNVLPLAAEPRAHLLPPEIIDKRKAKVLHRRLGFGVLAVLGVVVLGAGGAALMRSGAEVSLLAEQGRTADLLAQQAQYMPARVVQDKVALVEAAQQVGVSTEVDWRDYLNKVQASLPPGVTITAVNVDSSSPLEVYQQPTAALQGARVATINFTASSAVLPDVPTWLTQLATLPGYADALPGTVSLDTETNSYTADVTMHVNSDAFSHRFAEKETDSE